MSEDRIPPGYYTPEMLPPLSEGAAAIIAAVDATGPSPPLEGPEGSSGGVLHRRRTLCAPVGQLPAAGRI